MPPLHKLKLECSIDGKTTPNHDPYTLQHRKERMGSPYYPMFGALGNRVLLNKAWPLNLVFLFTLKFFSSRSGVYWAAVSTSNGFNLGLRIIPCHDRLPIGSRDSALVKCFCVYHLNYLFQNLHLKKMQNVFTSWRFPPVIHGVNMWQKWIGLFLHSILALKDCGL